MGLFLFGVKYNFMLYRLIFVWHFILYPYIT